MTTSRKIVVFLVALSALTVVLVVVLSPKQEEPVRLPIQVVASITPIGSLAQGIIGDLGVVLPIVDGQQSPHNFLLNIPSIRRLQNADILFYINDLFEPYIHELDKQEFKLSLVALADDAAFSISPVAALSLGFDDEHAEQTEHDTHQAEHDTHQAEHDPHHTEHDTHQGEHDTHHAGHDLEHDYHIWLEPNKAKIMTQIMLNTLIQHYPAHQLTLEKNARALTIRLDTLSDRIKNTLARYQRVPFMNYHDGLLYLSKQYALNYHGSLTRNPFDSLSIKKMQALRRYTQEQAIRCLFTDAHVPQALDQSLADLLDIRVVRLDYLGIDLPPPANGYFDTMNNLVGTMAACLNDTNKFLKK